MSRRIIGVRRGGSVEDRIQVPVADLAELRLVPTTDVVDKAIVHVEDSGHYRFDYQGTGTDDGEFTITPAAGPGRWFLYARNIGAGGAGQFRADLLQTAGSASGTGSSVELNAELASEVPGGSATERGLITEVPYNWVHVYDANDLPIDDGAGNRVYGRLTIELVVLTGTILVTQDGAAVTGTGTLFTAEVVAGQLVKLTGHGEAAWSRVASVTDDTNLVLDYGYRGASGSGSGQVGNWTCSFVSKVAGSEAAYTFVVNEPLELQVVRVYETSELPFASLLLEPQATVGGGGGGGGEAGADEYRYPLLLLPADDVTEIDWAHADLTVVKIQAYATTPPVTAGTYTLAITAAGNNVLAAATFDMTSLAAGVVTDLALTGTAAFLDLLEDDVIEVVLTSDNADLTGDGLWLKIVVEETGSATTDFDNTEGVVTVFTTYTFTSTDEVVVGDTAAGPYDITLPLAGGLDGRRVRVKRVGPSDLTVKRDGADTIYVIGSATSTVLEADGASVTLIADAANSRWLAV